MVIEIRVLDRDTHTHTWRLKQLKKIFIIPPIYFTFKYSKVDAYLTKNWGYAR